MENNMKDIGVRSPSRIGTFIGIFLIIVSIVGFFFFTKQLSEKVGNIEVDISSKADEIETIKSTIAAYESAQEELGISTEVERLESLRAIPAEMNQDEVIRDLIKITDTYDIELRTLSFGTGGSNYEGIDTLSINASFEGNYSDLVSFLEGIEQNPRAFKVETINVQLDEIAILNLQRATFSLTMKAYFSK